MVPYHVLYSGLCFLPLGAVAEVAVADSVEEEVDSVVEEAAVAEADQAEISNYFLSVFKSSLISIPNRLEISVSSMTLPLFVLDFSISELDLLLIASDIRSSISTFLNTKNSVGLSSSRAPTP